MSSKTVLTSSMASESPGTVLSESLHMCNDSPGTVLAESLYMHNDSLRTVPIDSLGYQENGTATVRRSIIKEDLQIMELERIPYRLTVCKASDISAVDLSAELYFIGKTDEELSLVCRTEDTPRCTTERDDGWRGFRIRGTLDFSLIGILSKISGILAEQKIGIFAVSTYNTDYILVKEENFERALSALCSEGYEVV